ncbi:MAG: hypothetical protein JXN65_06685 [Clostridia bacterium]|nr:hypothetical protein [Clostridia bacterium]
MSKINHFLKKLNVWILIVLALTGIILIFTQYFGRFPLDEKYAMDTQYFYTKAEFFGSLSAMDAASRLSYLMIHIADYIFMLGIYPLMGLIVARSFAKPMWMPIIPLLAFAFDFSENILFDLHLIIYPAQIGFLGTVAGICTPLKFAAFFLSVGLVIAALVKAVFFKKSKG